MVHKLSTTSRKFWEELHQFMRLREAREMDVSASVASIMSRVVREGDPALVALTREFDRCEITSENMRVSPQEVATALSLVAPELIKSLKFAASRIRAYSERQLPADERYTDEMGVMLGWKWTAIDSVGLYVPGGKAAYPSSVLMNAIPAAVAGVKRLAMVVPTPDGIVSNAVLAAAHIAGIDEIYRIGGAQAVAALAYGTQTIAPVDKIVGPGNAYVAEAKRQVFGRVGIDMIAGPSEIVVVADANSDPAWVAIDLLSQAEHDEMAQSILITDNSNFATRVEKALHQQLSTMNRVNIAHASWEHYGGIILVRDWIEAADVINAIAPEHVELCIDKPAQLEPYIRHAGAIFLGNHTPEAIGDYVAGPSHVLPTSRTARFSSGLSVFDFIKRTSLISCTPDAFARLGQFGEVLAYTEGLHAHARSMFIRKTETVPA
jgi:histidinol dehydrogenase